MDRDRRDRYKKKEREIKVYFILKLYTYIVGKRVFKGYWVLNYSRYLVSVERMEWIKLEDMCFLGEIIKM